MELLKGLLGVKKVERVNDSLRITYALDEGWFLAPSLKISAYEK